MEAVPELLEMLPDGAPVVHLVQCPYKPPADEGQHLKPHVPVPGRDIDRLEVHITHLASHTVHPSTSVC